jgi:hypothetical protein
MKLKTMLCHDHAIHYIVFEYFSRITSPQERNAKTNPALWKALGILKLGLIATENPIPQ